MTTIHFHDTIMTADEQVVGKAQRLYHYDGEEFAEVQGFTHFLKVFNFETGDDFYIPTEFISDRNAASSTIKLSIPFREIQTRTLSRKPRSIAYDLATVEELPTS